MGHWPVTIVDIGGYNLAVFSHLDLFTTSMIGTKVFGHMFFNIWKS